MPKNKTLVLGASENPDRYSNKAIRMLTEIEEPLVAVGRRAGSAHDVPIVTEYKSYNDVETVTLYVGPKHQGDIMDYVINEVSPDRIIFNPGTENPEFYQRADAAGIEVVEACTLVMIRTGQYH